MFKWIKKSIGYFVAFFSGILYMFWRNNVHGNRESTTEDRAHSRRVDEQRDEVEKLRNRITEAADVEHSTSKRLRELTAEIRGNTKGVK